MGKKLNALLTFLLAGSVLTACSSAPEETTPETTDYVTVMVNVDGLGFIAVTDDGTQPEIGDPRFQSTFMNVEPGTELIMTCEADEGYRFIRWTKDGAVYSTDQTITVTADESVEYIAVFMPDNGYEGEPVSDINDVKTLGDVLGLPSPGSAFGESCYVYAFDLDGIMYQAVAELDDTTAKALWDLEFDDPDYNRKLNELVAPLAVTKVVNITEEIPAQSELDGYVGKTFGELFDSGWYCTGWNYEDSVAYMNYRYFQMEAGFDPGIDRSAFDEDVLAKMTVESMKYSDIGDPSYFEEY